MLTAVTLLSFANAWPDTVVLDDKFFVNNPELPDWTEPEELFKGDVWRTTTAHSGLFRPALFVSLSIDSFLFGDWLAGYHISNIVLHLAVTLCLYGFLLHLLRSAPDPSRRAELYALLAALVFAVHPVHTEAVCSVFNRSDMLVTLGAVAGLWWLMHHLQRRAALAWTGLGLCYLLAMLSKETGVVIPGIAAALILVLSDESWGRRIRRCLPVLWMLLPLAVYFYLRTRALEVDEQVAALLPERAQRRAPGNELQFLGLEELLAAIGYWGEGLRLMVWPYPLKLYYSPTEGLRLAVLAAVQVVLLAAGLWQLRKGRSVLLVALAWHYLALLPSTRVIVFGGHAYPNLAERYLYFGSAGAALALAFALAWLGRRYTARKVLLPVLLSLLVMMPITWVRNNDWRTDVSLFEKEYRLSGTQPETLRLVTAAHQARGNQARGAEICDRHTDLFSRYTRFAHNCGRLYGLLGRTDDAQRVFEALLSEGEQRAGAAGDLALVHLQAGRVREAGEHFILSIEAERDPAIKMLRRGFMVAYLYPKDPERLAQAKLYFEAALELQPLLGAAKRYRAMMEAAIKQLNEEAAAAPPADSAQPPPNENDGSAETTAA